MNQIIAKPEPIDFGQYTNTQLGALAPLLGCIYKRRGMRRQFVVAYATLHGSAEVEPFPVYTLIATHGPPKGSEANQSGEEIGAEWVEVFGEHRAKFTILEFDERHRDKRRFDLVNHLRGVGLHKVVSARVFEQLAKVTPGTIGGTKTFWL